MVGRETCSVSSLETQAVVSFIHSLRVPRSAPFTEQSIEVLSVIQHWALDVEVRTSPFCLFAHLDGCGALAMHGNNTV